MGRHLTLSSVSRKNARYRWGVLCRVLAAVLGGYVVSALATAVLSLLLPGILGIARADAVLIATQAGFIWYTVVVVWVFHARSAWRSLGGVVAIGSMLGLLLYLARQL